MLHAFANYKTHAGYVWAAVMTDGELLCEKCVKGNYRLILQSTKDGSKNGWAFSGALTNSGESEETSNCAHCYKLLWDWEDTLKTPSASQIEKGGAR